MEVSLGGTQGDSTIARSLECTCATTLHNDWRPYLRGDRNDLEQPGPGLPTSLSGRDGVMWVMARGDLEASALSAEELDVRLEGWGGVKRPFETRCTPNRART